VCTRIEYGLSCTLLKSLWVCNTYVFISYFQQHNAVTDPVNQSSLGLHTGPSSKRFKLIRCYSTNGSSRNTSNLKYSTWYFRPQCLIAVLNVCLHARTVYLLNKIGGWLFASAQQHTFLNARLIRALLSLLLQPQISLCKRLMYNRGKYIYANAFVLTTVTISFVVAKIENVNWLWNW